MTQHHPEPATAQVLSRKLRNGQNVAIYNKCANSADLAEVITSDLNKGQDIPVKISYYPLAAKALETHKSDSVLRSERQSKLQRSLENFFGLYVTEVLPGNIGYIRLDRFDEFAPQARQFYDSVFRMLSPCRAVIVDLRYNYGGHPEAVRMLSGYFSEHSFSLNNFCSARDTIRRKTDPCSPGTLVPENLWILTSAATSAGAEDFIFSLQKNRALKIAGDTTAGIAYDTGLFTAGQGFVVTVPAWKKLSAADNSTWQGTGIAPDHFSPPEDALSKALIVICSDLINKSRIEHERAQLKKYMLDIKARKYKGIPVGRWKNADARHAILIRDSIHGPANVSLGFGAVRDFKTGPPFLSESNSAWFRFRFEKDTLLTLDIVPIDEKDDYDFTLFRCAGSSCADAIRRQEVKPLRLCHSGHHSYNGATGLSEYGSPDFVGPGPGSTYSQAVKVKAGEEYYLLVDVGNEYITRGQLPHGFMIYFHDYWPKKKTFALKNVYFPSGQSSLSPASLTGLNTMVAELKKNTALTIEIRGHTDNQGDETKNLELSAARAGAVRDYLISRGIEEKRVSARGYGSSKPLAPNNSEAGRKKNRRVELAVVMR